MNILTNKKIDVTSLEAYKTMPTIKSKDTDWMHWIDLLDKKYGNANATQIFLTIWSKRGTSQANTVALREYLKSHYGIQIDESILDKIADVGSGVGHFFGGIFKVGKTTFFIVGGILIAGFALTVFNVSKRSGDIAEGFVKARTGGK